MAKVDTSISKIQLWVTCQFQQKHCQISGNQLIICEAEDTIKGKQLIDIEREVLTSWAGQNSQQKKNKQQLPAKVEMVIRMKVMVTTNIETDLDITNRAQGTIKDIILHPEETNQREAEQIITTRLPLYLLVKLDWTCTTQRDGLDPCVIPVEPITQSMQIHAPEINSKTSQHTVKQCQFPLTPAYAFTNYQSQGQTILYVIMDITNPPMGGSACSTFMSHCHEFLACQQSGCFETLTQKFSKWHTTLSWSWKMIN